MKKFAIVFILIMFCTVTAYGVTIKALYVGESKCYKWLVKDQNGNALVPNVGDVVTFTLKRTATSSPDLIELIGVYVPDETTYNYLFILDSDETTGFATGEALWYLELTNSGDKIETVINVSKITIKK